MERIIKILIFTRLYGPKIFSLVWRLFVRFLRDRRADILERQHSSELAVQPSMWKESRLGLGSFYSSCTRNDTRRSAAVRNYTYISHGRGKVLPTAFGVINSMNMNTTF